MKNFLKTLAVASFIGAASASAHADIVAGDLLLGFQRTSNDPYLVIDLGQLGSIGSGFSTNINAYLTQAYGAGWNTDASLTFSLLSSSTFDQVTGGNSGTFPTFISSAATAAGNSSDFGGLTATKTTAGVDRTLVVAVAQVAGAINGTVNNYVGDNSSFVYAPNVTAITQSFGDSQAQSYTWGWMLQNGAVVNQSLFITSIPYGVMGQTVTSADNYVDLRALVNGATTTTVVNSFVLDSNGNFSTVAAVPEPGTYGLLGAGALAGIAAVRRRRRKIA